MNGGTIFFPDFIDYLSDLNLVFIKKSSWSCYNILPNYRVKKTSNLTIWRKKLSKNVYFSSKAVPKRHNFPQKSLWNPSINFTNLKILETVLNVIFLHYLRKKIFRVALSAHAKKSPQTSMLRQWISHWLYPAVSGIFQQWVKKRFYLSAFNLWEWDVIALFALASAKPWTWLMCQNIYPAKLIHMQAPNHGQVVWFIGH